jgi:type I restriction enzyme S subunit
MSEWHIGQLAELATGIRGVAYTPDQLCEFTSPETVTLLRSNNIQSGQLDFADVQIVPRVAVSDAQVMQPGDIAVCMSNGSKSLVGKAAPLISGPAEAITVGAFCSIFRPAPGSVRSFVKHAFQSASYRKQLDLALAGSAINNLRNSDLHAFQVPIPPPGEQTQIADVLDTLDTTIRQTEAIIAKLKQVKQGLLHDLLTRGIDGSGELRPPQSEAPHLYKASPLGWIPVAWSVVETAHRCSLITKGTTPASNQMWQGEEGVRFLRVDNLSFDGQLNFNASNFRISTVTHESELMRSQCLPGDVLTNIVGPPLGKLGLITEESGPININQAIALFRPTSDLLSNFLLTWLGSTLSQVWLRQRAKQTSGQVNLTLALCQELPIPDMTLIEQRAIVERVASSQARIDVEASTLHKLEQLKSGLMDDLLTGRVRVTPLLAQAPATQP